MPTINAIRLVDIEYDSGQKVIGDTLLLPKNRNALFHLANGGGKTLLIQLILQTLLPNETLNKRRISDLVAHKNYTGHIAIEWKLDSVEEYLLTGFCFTGGDEESEQLKYFSYLNQYSQDPEFGIASFPYVDDGKVISYNELLRLLKKKPERFMLFSGDGKRNSYVNALKTYGLFEKEWKQIKTTNNSEGGIEGLFERTGTSVQLLENFLIPAVDEVISSGEYGGDLSAAFVEFSNKLVRIPEYERNIRDLKALKDGVAGLHYSIKERYARERDFLKRLSLGGTLRVRLQEKIETQKGEKLAILEEVSNIEEEIREINFKLESTEHSQMASEYLQLAEDAAMKEEVLRKRKEGISELENFLNRANAIDDAIEVKRMEMGLTESLENLNLVTKDSAEIREEMNRTCAAYRFLLDEEIKRQNASLAMIDDERQKLSEKKKQLEEDKKLYERNRDSLKDSRNRIAYEIEAIRERENILLESYKNLIWLENPDLAVENFNSAKFRANQSLHSLEEEEKSTNSLIEENRQIQLETTIKLTEEKSNRANKYVALEKYTTEKEKLSQSILTLSIRQEIFPDSDAMLIRISNTLSQVKDLLFRGRKILEETRSKLEILDRFGFYLPNAEIVELEEILKREGINCISGAEWLKQINDQKIRRLVMKRHPLLPYSIIIGESELARVDKIFRVRILELDSPIPLIVRSPELIVNSEIENSSNALSISGQTFILWNRTHDLSLSSISLEKLASKLKSEAEDKERYLSSMGDKEEHCQKIHSAFSTFIQTYDKDFETRNRQELLLIDNEIERLTISIEEHKESIENLQKFCKELHYKTETSREELSRGETGLKDWQDWRDRLLERRRLFSERRILDGKIEAVEESIEKTASEISELSDSRNLELFEKRNELNNRLKSLHKELERIVIDEVEFEKPSKTLDEIRPIYSALSRSLSEKTVGLRDVERVIGEYRRGIERGKRMISSKGYGYEEVSGTERVNEVTREKARSDLKTLEELAKELAKELVTLGNKLAVRQDRLDRKRKEIQERYGKEPSEISDPVESRSAIKELLQEALHKKQGWEELSADCVEKIEFLARLLEKLETVLSAYSNQPFATFEDVEISVDERDFPGLVGRLGSELRELLAEITTAKEKTDRGFRVFKELLREKKNKILDDFVQRSLNHLEDDLDSITDEAFSSLYGSIDKYIEHTEMERDLLNQDRERLVERCLVRATQVAEQLERIDKNLRIQYGGKSVKAFQIELKSWRDRDLKAEMKHYIDLMLVEVRKIMDQSKSREEIMRFAQDHLSSRMLIEVISNLKQCRIRVLKPQQNRERLVFENWESLQKWSGGEQYAGYAAVFVALLSYTRSNFSGLNNPPKVLIVDNLFGKASSAHILEYVFEIMKNNNVQLITLSDIRKDFVYNHFPIVYSLKLRSSFNREYLQAALEESHYDITALGNSEEIQKQERLF